MRPVFMTELKFTEHQEICTTLSYDTFLHFESMIVVAVRAQRTPRFSPAACSLTRFSSSSFRAANIWSRTAAPENLELVPAEVIILEWS